jgi:hypothetical protein
LQGFQQRHVFGDIVVLPANPLGDFDLVSCGISDDYPDAGRPGVAMGASVHVGYELGHVTARLHPSPCVNYFPPSRHFRDTTLRSGEKISTGIKTALPSMFVLTPRKALTGAPSDMFELFSLVFAIAPKMGVDNFAKRFIFVDVDG